VQAALPRPLAAMFCARRRHTACRTFCVAFVLPEVVAVCQMFTMPPA